MNRYRILVSAGRGPVEVRRFVGRLGQRLFELCSESALVVLEVLVRGDEDCPSSVEIRVTGDAPRVLGGEQGTHALVARSRTRGKEARKRWFAGVTIHLLDDAAGAGAALPIDPKDLEITATCASGPGGQHVNKVATAVRVHHRPTGITVRVSDERSQRANIQRAIARIAARVASDAEARRAEGEGARRLLHHELERGAPVRIYRTGLRGALELC